MAEDMRNDHLYAEMLNVMRSQGSKDNPTTIQLGVMQSANSVKLDDLVLNAEDLYVSDHLDTGYTDGLKKGDLVAVQKLNNNMYIILARVVRL